MSVEPSTPIENIQQHGDCRTTLLILDIYDEMTWAIETGQPYQARLDPPPGPPTSGLPNWPPHIAERKRAGAQVGLDH